MNKPNILLITTDQQRFDTLSAVAGNDEIYTPHLDWLSDEGITFTRAYADSPICQPSRATIMTGKCGYTLGITGNSHFIQGMAHQKTLPGLLTQAGYQTRAQGKMHFEPMRKNYGFETMELPMDYYREMHRRGGALPKEHGVGENESVPVISTVSEQDSLTHWTVQRSIDFLETRDESRPFFMWTSFTKPHPPFDPTANYWALYCNRNVSPPTYGDWSKEVESMDQGFMESTYMLNNNQRSGPEKLKDMKRAYYACITQIDYQLGLLFARMREMNLFENTWIIFTSDHGEMLGDHHMGAKSVFLEGSAHVPLIIRKPIKAWTLPENHEGNGLRIDTLTQMADIMPTILDMAGVEIPEDCDGQSILSFKQEDEDRVFFGDSGGSQFAVIKNNWKLCFTATGGGMLLFNLNDDPRETKNLIKESACESIKNELITILREKLIKYEPELIKEGEIHPRPAISGTKDVLKWPGFHSTVFPSDVLH
jgi:arylsulfatase